MSKGGMIDSSHASAGVTSSAGESCSSRQLDVAAELRIRRSSEGYEWQQVRVVSHVGEPIVEAPVADSFKTTDSVQPDDRISDSSPSLIPERSVGPRTGSERQTHVPRRTTCRR